MRIYVDELPKSCEKCKFYEYEIEHNGEWGFETHRRMCKINGSLIQGICPLQSLTDYTKQVRKEVCDELLVAYAKRLSAFIGCKISISTAIEKFKEVLDQIQGEIK